MPDINYKTRSRAWKNYWSAKREAEQCFGSGDVPGPLMICGVFFVITLFFALTSLLVVFKEPEYAFLACAVFSLTYFINVALYQEYKRLNELADRFNEEEVNLPYEYTLESSTTEELKDFANRKSYELRLKLFRNGIEPFLVIERNENAPGVHMRFTVYEKDVKRAEEILPKSVAYQNDIVFQVRLFSKPNPIVEQRIF